MSSSATDSQQGFILTRQWRDTRNGIELEYWLSTADGPVKIVVPGQQAVFFIPAVQHAEASRVLQSLPGWSCKQLSMCDFTLAKVWGYYFDSQRNLRKARELLRAQEYNPLEADINPQDRFLMERFVRGSVQFRPRRDGVVSGKQYTVVNKPKISASDYQPRLKIISLDIETAMQELQLYSIAVYAKDGADEFKKVFMVSEQPVARKVEIFANDRLLLIGFLAWLQDYDPDVIIGWNVINFDCWYLQQLCQKYGLQFSCGRGANSRSASAHWRTLDDEGERRAVSVPGRVIVDGIELLKAAHYQFESFSLAYVARQMLADDKLIQGSDRGDKISELFHQQKSQLADYNIQDCKLVWDIFAKAGLIAFAIARSQITGLALDRSGGSVASFDFRYLPLLHRQGFVAPNGHHSELAASSPGGLVMNSRPGIYDYVAVLDFKSLYPSIIRSFNIDPLAMAVGIGSDLPQSELVPGFNGAWFARRQSILPELISELWQLRDGAKASHDAALSQAIKIIMNSFYGVLGSAGCRFFDSRLASSITRRGHQIIRQTADYIEQQGWPVLYGDTDSVFVWFNNAASEQQASDCARQLEGQLNRWWQDKLRQEYQLESALEIEFETLYLRFLMPTVRGSDQGSKKRYAGTVMKNGQAELVFKGLENVRSDWTRLARDFQLGLYQRVFFNEPYVQYIKTLVKEVLAGEHDQALVYRKRLRRKLADYQRNIPPHVQAARKAAAAGVKVRRGDWVEYLITVNGPEPVAEQCSRIDYQHYIDKQLAPVADGILYFFEQSLAQIIDQQLMLFD